MTTLTRLLDTFQSCAEDLHQAHSHGTHGDDRVKDARAALMDARIAIVNHVRENGYTGS